MCTGFKSKLLVVLLVFSLPGLSTTAPASDAGLFDENGVLDLSLEVDFDALCRPREVEDCQYWPTKLGYRDAEGVERKISVEIRIRGGWRSRKAHCKVPPLFVRFLATDTQGTPFAGQDLLPLTTHCKSRGPAGSSAAVSKEYQQYVIKEYLGYRLFNILSDMSLRVRLVRIKYSAAEGSFGSATRYAFFSEHFDSLATRHQATRMPERSFDPEKIEPMAFDTVALYQFMIANTDWSVVRERNVVLIHTPDGRQFPAPFDLDMSGLVDAEYSGVSLRLKEIISDVNERLYLGHCQPDTDWQTLFTQFQQHKVAMFELLDETPGLTRKTKRRSMSFLKKFFAILDSPKLRQAKIVEACLPWPPSPDDHTTPPELPESG